MAVWTWIVETLRTYSELADQPYTRGVHLRRIKRNLVEIPILPEAQVLYGDILTIGGSKSTDITAVGMGIVLLNGGGFDAPDWSVRISFANLSDYVYDDIGRAVRAVARAQDSGPPSPAQERKPVTA